jgi:hypothetical protein
MLRCITREWATPITPDDGWACSVLWADGKELHSPMTGLPMDAMYFPNVSMRGMVLDYIEARQRERKER